MINDPFVYACLIRGKACASRGLKIWGSRRLTVTMQWAREWPGSLRPTNAETQTASSYKDTWCSDQLGAVILQSQMAAGAKLSNKKDTLMQKIQRTEPNASLFQIPSDYTILEREQAGGPFARRVAGP
jgi:hypothetical protein